MKVRLYIGNNLADIEDDSLILFTYTMDDLSNPTIVKNSYSQQITLPGTSTNNLIFGEMFRLDRQQVTSPETTGMAFNPSKRTPFEIRSEMNEILESGYLKLDNIVKKGNTQEYKVTLYGGLGSFFYNLAYDNEGNKKTLADINYLHNGNKDGELDFTINATFVQNCWTRLLGTYPATPAQIADVINFAPCYNGIPENFDANKGLASPSSCGGLSSSVTEDGSTYTTKSGYTLVEMPEDITEWAAKDLRSYLQRPVLSIRAFLNALTHSDNCGGYSFDCSDLLTRGTHEFSYLWMTLPLLPSLTTYRQETRTVTITPDTITYHEGNSYIPITIGSTIPANSEVNITFSAKVALQSPTALSAGCAKVYFQRYKDEADDDYSHDISGMFLQLVAFDSSNNMVGASKVVCVGDKKGIWQKRGRDVGIEQDTMTRASVMGYTPVYDNLTDKWGEYYASDASQVGSTDKYCIDEELSFSLTAYSISSLRLYVTPYLWHDSRTSQGVTTGESAQYVMVSDSGERKQYTKYIGDAGTRTNTATYETSDTLRSGAKVTKQMLLTTSYSPADLLLSLAKALGLSFLYDKGTKVVKVVFRNNLYKNETINIQSRIDRSKNISITPLVFDTKWLTMEQESAEGEFEESYESLYGVSYGMQKIDTGYDFNAEATALMDSLVFGNAVTSLEYGKYYNNVFVGAVFWPSPFLTTGCKQTLWTAAGASTEVDMSIPVSPTINYFGEEDDGNLPGYDYPKDRKLQMHGEDNKPVDGDNVLVFLSSWGWYPYFKLTDDSATMYSINGGVPCWWLDPGASSPGLHIPIFGRYNDGDGYIIETALDFGRARELNAPNLSYYTGMVTLYERMWKKYLADRYDINTRKVTCYVDMRGMQVGEEMLRKFYYFDGAIWSLNKIKDYSLTTVAPVECEFIKVQDIGNYRKGQDYDFYPTNIYEVLDEDYDETSVVDATKTRNKVVINGSGVYEEEGDAGYGYLKIKILEDCKIVLTASCEEDADYGYVCTSRACTTYADVQNYADVYVSGDGGEGEWDCNAGDVLYIGYTKDSSCCENDDNIEFLFQLT